VIDALTKPLDSWWPKASKVFVIIPLLLLSGCAGSLLSGAGPNYHSVLTAPENPEVVFDIIDLTPVTIRPFMLEAQPVDRRIITGGLSPTQLRPYDVLSVMIAQHNSDSGPFAALASGGTSFTDVRLDAAGQIELPVVGLINANGLTTQQLASAIRKRLETTVKTPEVRVTLTGDLSNSVLVMGAVEKPGRYSALTGPLTLLDVITQAGGAKAQPHLISVIVRSASGVQELAYQDVLFGHNLVLEPRSEVVLERNRQSFIAMGAVNTPGLFDLPSSHPSLLQALGVVGGLQQATADPAGVFVFRRAGFDQNDKPIAQIFRLDMSRPESIMLASAFRVQADDALYVTNAGIYEAQKVIAPIVQMIILGNTVTGQ
jgi:polysaccharide export outer membrane protein